MKKALFSLFVVIGSLSTQAAYLYWQVGDLTGIDSEVTGSVKATNGEGDPVALTSYYLYSDPTTGLMSWKESDGTETVGADTQYAAYISDDYAQDGWSYYVELANETETVARSASIAYSEEDDSAFAAYTSATTSSTDLPDATSADSWHASSGGYTPVPEPTSALLMLFGAAFLGLKRKNRSIA